MGPAVTTRAAALRTLALPSDAPVEDVRRAWRRIARETHPDLHPGDPAALARFTAAREAYELLTSDSPPAPTGPGPDWFDACAWMAESHLLHLRREALPRFATVAGGGPSLAKALADGVDGGLAAIEGTPSAWGRLWAWSTWRRLELVIDEGWPMGSSPVSLYPRDGRLLLVLWPRQLWVAGIRDDDAVRTVVRRAVDLGVAAAAPELLGLGSFDPANPGADRTWWVGRLFWPVVWVLVGLFSVFLLFSADR